MPYTVFLRAVSSQGRRGHEYSYTFIRQTVGLFLTSLFLTSSSVYVLTLANACNGGRRTFSTCSMHMQLGVTCHIPKGASKNGLPVKETFENLPFHIATDQIKYFCITIPKDPKLIYKINYLKGIEKLKSNIEIWRLLPLSMIGRINVCKLYGDSKHTVYLKNTTKPKAIGGLNLPNFQHYYWAANSRAQMYWNNAYPGKITSSTPSWLAIEKDIPNSCLSALLFSVTKPPTAITGNNFRVKHSLTLEPPELTPLGVVIQKCHCN